MRHFSALALACSVVAVCGGSAKPEGAVEIGSPFDASKKAPLPEKPGSVCKSIDTCGECVAEQSCGWCSDTQTCVPGDGDAPTAGNGTCSLYEYGLCKSEPCKLYPTCTSCLADPLCGWCASTGMCAEGHPDTGPLHMGRMCAGAWCHSPRFEDRRDAYIHAMLDEEIEDICDNGCLQPHATGATGAGATGSAGLLEDVTKSFPDLNPKDAAEAAAGGEVLEEAVGAAVSKAAAKVPEKYREAVQESVKEAIESVSITPEESAMVRAKARADLVTFEQSRLDAVRKVKGTVEGEQEKIDVLLDRQQGDWPTAVNEATTVVANALAANRELLSNDPESKRWTEEVRVYLKRVEAQVETAFGAPKSAEATRAAAEQLEDDKERVASAEAGVAADAGQSVLLAMRSRTLRRRTTAEDPAAVKAALAKEFPGLTAEEAKIVSNLVPSLGDGEGRVPALQAKLAAKRVIEGRRSAERAERDAEAYMDEALAAKKAAFESAEEEIKGAALLNSTDIKRDALKRLAEAQLSYRTAVMGVETAVAEVKAMLSSDNAMLMTNGEAVVNEMAGSDIAAKEEADKQAEEKAEEAYHAKIEKKLEKQAEEEKREEEEVEKLSKDTDAHTVASEE